MFSPEFMKYLVNYQKPEYDDSVNRSVKYFKYGLKDRIAAAVFVTCKK